MTLQVRLFGRVRARTESGPVAGLENRKVQELLSYLVLERRRPTHRGVLAEHLWSGVTSSNCRKQLRQTLWKLQGVLAACGCGELLRPEADWVQLRDTPDLWVDVVELQGVYERCCAGAAAPPPEDD